MNKYFSVPPSEPRIFDDQGRELSSVAGPFKEGSDLFLSCQVTGGNICFYNQTHNLQQ